MAFSLKDAISSKYAILQSSAESPTSDTSGLPKPIQKALSGTASGLVTTAFLHPFEVLKIRMQSDATLKHKQTWKDLYYQVKTVGIYNGAGANIIASGMAWGVYFGLFETFKPYTHAYIYDQKTKILADFAASLSASTISQFLTNPLWVLKTRMSLQNVALPGTAAVGTGAGAAAVAAGATTEAAAGRSHAYRNVFHGLYRLAKEEGIRGYYKGFSATLLGMLHGAVVMTVYQQLKPSIQSAADSDTESPDSKKGYVDCDGKGSWLSLLTASSVAAFLSKVIATSLTYPTQVVRTRMQDHRYYLQCGKEQSLGLWRILCDIWQLNGVKGLYRGMSMHLVRAGIANVLIFSLYESAQKVINDMYTRHREK